MTQTVYVLDSSFLIKLYREQPIDVYVTLWDSIDALLSSGGAIVPREAYREIERRDDALHDWLKGRAGVVEADADEVHVVAEIGARYPSWVQGPRNAADPFVIAAALVRGGTVVTDERMAGPTADERNLRIPNVGAVFGVEVILPTEMIRRCGWRF